MATGQSILIVEDDPDVAATVRLRLEREGYLCEVASNGDDALASVRRHAPDLVLLDRILPGLSGDEVLRRLKNDPRTSSIPVIMLTGKGEESDELVGLALGADDYISKPFSGRRLIARIQTQLRRKERLASAAGGAPPKSITLDRRQTRLLVDKTPVQLTVTEYKILATLIAAQGHVLSVEKLIAMVHGDKAPEDEYQMEHQIEGLLVKMGPAATCIQAIHDQGYAFCPPRSQRPQA